jgi:hypothetical protein
VEESRVYVEFSTLGRKRRRLNKYVSTIRARNIRNMKERKKKRNKNKEGE